MASIVTDLLDMMPDTIIATPVVLNGYGEVIPSGEVLALPCYVSGRQQLVRDAGGQEVTSNRHAVVGGVNSLTVAGHRYTLPARFDPREDLRAIAVKPSSDEDGAHHETVYFP
jgi:hypothetical protein